MVAWLKRLDWGHRLAYVNARETDRLPPHDPPLDPKRLLEEMHLITPDGRHVYHGFGAFRWLWKDSPARGRQQHRRYQRAAMHHRRAARAA